MAAVVRDLTCTVRQIAQQNVKVKSIGLSQSRTVVTSESGAILEKPNKVPFGIPHVILTVLPGLYLGATMSKEGAAFLEENDIFVPDDDDEED